MNRRTERIGRSMQHAIGRILLRNLSDPRIEPALTSITRVRVQEDLLRAKVYVSILGTDSQQRRGIEALNHAAGRIQALLRQEIQLRQMPLLEFLPDEQFKGALRTWEIISEAMDEIRAKEQQTAGDESALPAENTAADAPPRQAQDQT